MYRADAARSGYTPESLPESLTPCWTYCCADPPMPAWPTRDRQRYDVAFQPVIVGSSLFFGSSANGKVYALDVSTGKSRWQFFTDGPVRFAPAGWKDRLMVASDDGYLYCLAGSDGRLLWKLRGGPRDDMLLGNDRMVSRWPARGGPVVVGDVAYFGAGIWPSEGIFLRALDPATGEILWCNDSSGSLEMDQPHSTARAKSGIAAQGYLAADRDRLYVPTGRAVPAVLSRATGKLLYCQFQANTHAGGADVIAIGDWFFNAGSVYDAATGLSLGRTGTAAALHPQYVLLSGKQSLTAMDRARLVTSRSIVDRKGKEVKASALAPPAFAVELPSEAMVRQPHRKGTEKPEDKLMRQTNWSDLDIEGQPAAIVVAGDHAIIGGQNKVLRVDLRERRIVWSHDVEGLASGLAVADGRLYVSTDRGILTCFSATPPGEESRPPTRVAEKHTLPQSDPDDAYERAAVEIVRRTGVTDGYCLDIGCGDGRLALALARRTNLKIYAVEWDDKRVAAARRMLDEAGLYGTRVTVHRFDLTGIPYADYFADLVISGRSVDEGPEAVLPAAYERMQRPYGGKACFGRPGAMTESTRGALPGAGSWTHQNTDPSNTLCSEDTRVRAPLAMLWFRDTDFVMPLRHGRGPAPLIDQGRMFAEGVHGLRATNIYNGRTLWEYSIENVLSTYHREHSIGAAWTAGNYCLGNGRLFVHHGSRCLCLDAQTGKKLAEFHAPARADGTPGTWGYIAYAGGTLFGTLADEDYLAGCWSPNWDTSGQFIQSTRLFALDSRSGKLQWIYAPKHSIRNNAIAIGAGRVYLIDRPPSEVDDRRYTGDTLRADAKQRAAGDAMLEKRLYRDSLPRQPFGRLVALDAATGKCLWQNEEEVFGTQLAVSNKHGLVLMCYQPGHQASFHSELGNRMAAISTADGKRVWDIQAEYVARPILNDHTIYAEPGAWDLLSGRRIPFTLDRSYGCGIPAGSRNLLVFRSATLGYIDLTKGDTTENYGGIRPGCWVNVIPAGGLVLMADAASWCTCSYLNQATIALKPVTAK